MKKFGRMLIVVGIVVGCAQIASAQGVTGISEFTAFFGRTFGLTEQNTGGASFTINVSPYLGIEGEAGVIFGDENMFNVNLNLIANFGSGTSLLIPYVTGGAGILHDDGTDIALNAGVGMKLFVEPNIALRADVRGFFITESGDVKDMERLYGGFEFFF